MTLSKRWTLGTGFGVIIGLLVLSTVLAYQIQEAFSERSVAIHRRYVNEQETVTALRRTLYLSSVAVRDFLLNPNENRVPAYRKQISDLRAESARLLLELKNSTNSVTNRHLLSELENNVTSLWSALESAPGRGTNNLENYNFVQQQIAPKRQIASRILQDLEAANHSALQDFEEDFRTSRTAATRKLLALLGCCLLGGVVIAWFSLRYSNHLERQAAARFAEILAAKLELERLSSRLMEIQEEERTRLSRELHDEIVQNLAVLKIDITHALAALPSSGNAREALTRARELADRTVRTVRDISLLLRPSLLDDLGLGPALQWLTEDFSRRTGVRCEYLESEISENLPEAVKTCVYRVTQEALRNCEKHSLATAVKVEIRQGSGSLRANIQDNGVGYPANHRPTLSLGVLGMRERAAALGGELEIISSTGGGTCVTLTLPGAQRKERTQSLEAHV